jgi:hypothetical protein
MLSPGLRSSNIHSQPRIRRGRPDLYALAGGSLCCDKFPVTPTGLLEIWLTHNLWRRGSLLKDEHHAERVSGKFRDDVVAIALKRQSSFA